MPQILQKPLSRQYLFPLFRQEALGVGVGVAVALWVGVGVLVADTGGLVVGVVVKVGLIPNEVEGIGVGVLVRVALGVVERGTEVGDMLTARQPSGIVFPEDTP